MMVPSSTLSAVSSMLVVFPDAVVEAGITNVFFVSPFPPSSGAGISLSLQEVNSPPVSITAAIPVNK